MGANSDAKRPRIDLAYFATRLVHAGSVCQAICAKDGARPLPNRILRGTRRLQTRRDPATNLLSIQVRTNDRPAVPEFRRVRTRVDRSSIDAYEKARLSTIYLLRHGQAGTPGCLRFSLR